MLIDRNTIIISMLVCLIVFFAMLVDLAAGWRKASVRGEAHTSEALRRTLTKFITYEGSVLIAACIDVITSFVGFFGLIGLEGLDHVPVTACIVGVFLCAVEILSLRENADAKLRKQEKKALDLLAGMLKEDGVRDKLLSVIKEAQSNENANA